MTTNYIENECFNVHWKIKNFYYCFETVATPEFCVSEERYYLALKPNSEDIEFRVQSHYLENYSHSMQVSILTWDGSPEEAVSGGNSEELRLLVSKDVIFGTRRNAFLTADALTVRLRILTDSGRGKICFTDQIGVKRSCFMWTQKDFTECRDFPKKTVENSPLYGEIQIKFKLVDEIDSNEQFTIKVSRLNQLTKCYCVLKISVLDVDGETFKEVSDKFYFLSDYSGRQQLRLFPSIIKKSEWVESKNQLLLGDALRLKCYFSVSRGGLFMDQYATIDYCENDKHLVEEYDNLSMTFDGEQNNTHVAQCQTDLKSTLDNETFFDVCLRVGSKIFLAHKFILSSRSTVFKTMFSKDAKNTTRSTVDIENLEMETVRALLLYIYTDTLPDKERGNMEKLYFAAVTYGVPSLKRKCTFLMKKNLSVSNVCEALVLAELHKGTDLNIAVVDFISENGSEVFASEEWKELEKNNSSLAFQIMREIYCNMRNWNELK